MVFTLDTFSANIFAPVLTIFGLFGNLFGLIVISKKKLHKIGPQTSYIAMFIFDWINLVTIFKPYLQYGLNIDITTFGSLACKSYWYISYAFATISPMLNVYISIERFISIAYPSKKYILLKDNIQLAYIITLTLFNLGLYVPIGIYFDVITVSNNRTVCDFVDIDWLHTCGYIDLVNRVIIPSLLMIIFSILIIRTIFKSRSRMSSTSKVNKTFQKDVRFSLMSILLNIAYCVFSLPVSILLLFPNYWLNPLYVFFSFVFFLAYSANFYLILTANRLFRGGFLSIFACSKNQQQKNGRIVGETNVNSKPGARDEFSLQYRADFSLQQI